MTKCDFCPKYVNGKCWWKSITREHDCQRAIAKMIEVLKDNNKQTK